MPVSEHRNGADQAGKAGMRLKIFLLLVLAVTSSSLIVWHFASAVSSTGVNSVCEPGGCAAGAPFTFTIYVDGSNFLAARSKGGGNAFSETAVVTLFHDIEGDPQCSGGCRIEVQSGTYPMSGGGDTCVAASSNTLCLKSNLFIQGNGEGNTIFQGTSGQNTNIFATWAMTNVTLMDFSLDTHGNAGYGISLFNCTNCLAQNVRVFNTQAQKPNTAIAEFGNRNRLINDIGEGASSLCFELGNGDRGTEAIADIGRNCTTGIQFDGGNNQVNGITGDVYNAIIGGEYYLDTTGVQCTDCKGIVIDGVSAHNNTLIGIALGIMSLSVTQVWGTISNSLVMFNGNGAGSSTGIQLIGHGSQAIADTVYDNNNQAFNLNGDNLKMIGNNIFDDQGAPTQANAFVTNGGNTATGVLEGNTKGTGVTTWIAGGGTFTGLVSVNNPGNNPVGAVTNFVENTGHTANPNSGTTTPSSATTYTVKITPMQLIIIGGTVTVISVNGKTIATTATTEVLELAIGDSFSVTFSVAPTWQATFR